MLRRSEIRALVEEHGPQGYLDIQARMLGLGADGRMGRDEDGVPILESHVVLENGRKIPRIRPEQFSIRALWEGLEGPCEETLAYAQQGFGYIEHPMDFLQEADSGGLSTGLFPSAVGQLIATRVIEGYTAAPGIGDELVTVMPSTMRGERVVGFTSLQGPKEVTEGDEYEDSTFGEKYVTTTETKRGRLLSITEEAVHHDQTGQVLRRASLLGRKAADDRERRIVRGVADVKSTERIFRPSGTAGQLYVHATYTNLLATATPLVDWTDIQEAMAYHAENMKDDRETDDNLAGQPIVWNPTHLLTAVKLQGVAARIMAATIATAGSVEAPSGAILNAMGVGGLKPVSSPYLDTAAADAADDQYTDADDWFLGDFANQFIYKENWPLQTFRAPLSSDAAFRRDILAEFKVREYGDVNAIDSKLVVQVNAV